jgi:hypothetical protein
VRVVEELPDGVSKTTDELPPVTVTDQLVPLGRLLAVKMRANTFAYETGMV